MSAVASSCECGCGLPTDIAPKTYSRLGQVRGQPKRFVRGHHARDPLIRARMAAAVRPTGPAHPNWIGDAASYTAVHTWVQRHRPKTGVCRWCGTAGHTENANVDHTYRRNLEDYLELCKPCHNELDEVLL